MHDASKPQHDSSFNLPWNVLHVRSNQEWRVAAHLQSRGIEHFLPVYEAVRLWKDRRVVRDAPLFPGYIFVKVPPTSRLTIVTIPNIVSLLGTRQMPAAVSDDELEWIRRGTRSGTAQPYPYVDAGVTVTITAGVMAGIRGVLVRRLHCARVLVRIPSVARAFTVEVDSDSVQIEATQQTPAAS